MRAVAAGLTDVGLQREHNEDSFVVADQHDLFVVADGMGGHKAGDVASKMATETMVDFFDTVASEDVTWPFSFDPSLSEEENRLLTGVRLANRQIVEFGNQSVEHQGMGTTIVAALFSPARRRLYVCHVGDSRAYRIRGDKIEQITRDHSLVNDYLSAMPDMTEEQMSELPKNVITRALGMQEQVAVDSGVFDAEIGDVYLICSDGLSGMIDDEELRTLSTASKDLDADCRRLINVANAHGGEDNVTALLIRIEESNQEGYRATLPDGVTS
ncbi:MAG: Stp1/IreP family PP2C-type Ser/Thr phosphatase [Polyangiaceae bacterium]|nr:Stp1/IreP family PP2C-type Ser/Thr phosphatase [Polyangiaceae bacterium]